MNTDVYHTTDGSGDWILCWKWEFQKLFQCMGWTYHLNFTTEELAKRWLTEYVKPSFPTEEFQIKPRTGLRDVISR